MKLLKKANVLMIAERFEIMHNKHITTVSRVTGIIFSAADREKYEWHARYISLKCIRIYKIWHSVFRRVILGNSGSWVVGDEFGDSKKPNADSSAFWAAD